MRTIASLVTLLAVAAAWAAPAKPPVAITPGRDDSFVKVYERQKDRGTPTLITSDSVLHTAHLLFSYTLRAAELRKFDANLRELTREMRARMTRLAEEEAGKRYFMQPPPYGYDRVAAYFAVAERLLDPAAKTPALVKDRVDREVALIMAADAMAESPVMGVTEDYTQYVPRGHYTRNEGFKRFFRAMMWYGRAGFPISGEKAPGKPLTKEEARANAWAGLMLARNVDALPLYRHPNSPTTLSLWRSIYEPTSFIVGKSDDLTPPEYTALAEKVFGKDLPGAWLADAQAKTDAFIAEAAKLRPARIFGTVQTDAVAAPPVSLRFMGQRYILDSDVFQQLVHPAVPERLMPTGLDIMAAFGSPEAYGRLKGEMAHPKYGPAYAKAIGALQKEIAGMPHERWSDTAYTMWLATIRTLVADPSLQPGILNANMTYPDWWRDPRWRAKQLNTGLGSWAELRHDTILYAKQSYTVGVTSFIPPAKDPAVYVEPVPLVYRNLRDMTKALQDALTAQKVFPEEMRGQYAEFQALLDSLAKISMDQLGNPGVDGLSTPPAKDDYARARNIGAILRQVETLPPALQEQLTGDEDAQAALIADVHTDPNNGDVLEVGIGPVWTVAVTMPIDGKPITLTGPIFSYYEFTQPMAKRLTDSLWQEKLQMGAQGKAKVLE